MATLAARQAAPSPEDMIESINTREMPRYDGFMQGAKSVKSGAVGVKGIGYQAQGGGREVPTGPFSIEDTSSGQSGQDDDCASSYGGASPRSPAASVAGDRTVDGKLLDKRVRHKKVEQNRRELTRKFTEELQQLTLGATVTQGTCINTVLEGVLQYLQKGQSGANKRKRSDSVEGPMADACFRLSLPNQMQVPRGFTEGMFGGAFESAPMGIIMASTAGTVLRCNPIFFNLFGLDKIEGTPSMFSLTAPSSIPATMQAASALITGTTNSIKVVKRCLRRGGVEDEFQVQMNVVQKENKPQYFVCYVRHTNTNRAKVEEVPEHTEQYGRQYSKFVTDVPFSFPPAKEEEIEDTDLDGFFRSLDSGGPSDGHMDPLM